MTGQKRRKRATVPEETFRWGNGTGAEVTGPPEAPVLALLALDDALLASHADGRVIALPVRAGQEPLVGAPREVHRVDPPVSALAFCADEALGASGNRLVRMAPDGTTPAPIELDAPVGAVVARKGRVHAVAGDAVYTFERDGEGWSLLHRTPVPLSDCHDIDVDRRGKHVVVCERPHRGRVVELGTGAVVGHCDVPESYRQTIEEIYARFSPVTDNLYRAASRAHKLEKLARLGKSGRALGWKHDLDQPSTWCTPLASSPDGLYVASRQSGVGVLVWDLGAERQILFAELDDAPGQDKYAKRMRRMPVATRPVGADSIKVTRWSALPGQDGEATAVAVAPGARYAATGGRDGAVTVIDGRTRRIEHGDCRVRQPSCLTSVVETGDPKAWAFADGSWTGVFEDGTLTTVDLATGLAGSPGSVEIQDLSSFKVRFDGDELVAVSWKEARAFDRRTLAPVWRAEDPLPGCGFLRHSGSELLAYDGSAGRIRRYLPRTRERLDGPSIPHESGRPQQVDDIALNRRTGWFAVKARYGHSDTPWYLISPDGEAGPLLPEDTEILPDEEHAVVPHRGGWRIISLGDPENPLHTAEDLEPAFGLPYADLTAGLAVAQDFNTRRFHVWTLDGDPVASFDGIGESRASGYVFVSGALWVYSGTGGVLYRLDLP